MQQQQLFELSCRAAQELLEDLERGNLDQLEANLARIRHYAALAEAAPVDSLRGEGLERREQLEALGGIVDRVGGSLRGISRQLAAELESLGASHNLLEHIVSGGRQTAPGPHRRPTPIVQFRAAGCTSPGARIESPNPL